MASSYLSYPAAGSGTSTPRTPRPARSRPSPEAVARRQARLASGGQAVAGAGRQGVSAARETASSTSSLLHGHKVSLAGFVLGLLGYAVGVNLLQGGPAQVRGWFDAKFLNRAYTPAKPATSTATGAPAGAATTVQLAAATTPVVAPQGLGAVA